MPLRLQNRARFRAIISDDDEFFRVALRSVLLGRNGFSEVIETASFDQAVDQLHGIGPVDVGLFDLNMLGMKNWLDLSALRQEYPDMRLIVVSASRSREDVLNSLKIGAHGFIHKGQGACELSRAVDLICDGHVYIPPFLPENPTGTAPEDFGTITPRTTKAQACSINGPTLSSAVHIEEVCPEPTLCCSPRQREIIDLLIDGQSNKGMARILNLSEGTIKFHMSAVLRLLDANGRVEAATKAMRLLSRQHDTPGNLT